VSHFERCRARNGKRFTLRLPTAPPFIGLSDPVEIKEVFMAPADVLHPGAGSERVLWPFMGANSVILLDEGAHMEQRKLLLPALHGEKMQRLNGAMREMSARSPAGPAGLRSSCTTASSA
jgi:cytochrome P450